MKTPREVSLIFEGKAEQFVREHDERAWLAWHISALPRSKRLPPLKKLLSKRRSKKPQSAEHMLLIAKQWTLLLGGEVTSKPTEG